MRWNAPTNGIECARTVLQEPKQGAFITGCILAMGRFLVYGVGPDGRVIFNKAMSRPRLYGFLAAQKVCVVAMEACATSHHWGRVAQSHGHEVRLVPAAYVRPFAKRQKNDRADAEAIAEAASRPSMPFVAVKSAEKQGRAVAFRTHQCLVRQRTQLINALRGHLAEFGRAAEPYRSVDKALHQVTLRRADIGLEDIDARLPLPFIDAHQLAMLPAIETQYGPVVEVTQIQRAQLNTTLTTQQ